MAQHASLSTGPTREEVFFIDWSPFARLQVDKRLIFEAGFDPVKVVDDAFARLSRNATPAQRYELHMSRALLRRRDGFREEVEAEYVLRLDGFELHKVNFL